MQIYAGLEAENKRKHTCENEPTWRWLYLSIDKMIGMIRMELAERSLHQIT